MAAATGATPSRSVLLFGTDEPVSPLRRLAAGPLSAGLYRGNLRYVRWGGLEVIRAVSFIVRDTKWGTHSLAVSDLRIEETPTTFLVTYGACCQSDDGAFAFTARIDGRADGTLAFRATGGSPHGFATNRTGFIVLHPLVGVVGHDLAVERASGGTVRTRFPDRVEPGTPATDIRALSHEPRPGLRVTVRMEGEAFEMEDHRNWTDASFKTYVRPLALGYPYRIAAGETVEQAVTVSIAGPAPAMADDAGDTVVTLGAVKGTIPRAGLFLDDADLAGVERVADRVAELGASFLIARIDLSDHRPGERLRTLHALAERLKTPLALEVVIPGVSPEVELAPVVAAIEAVKPDLDSILVVPARDLKSRPADAVPEGEASPAAILATARKLLPGFRIGGGMALPFPELNRNRPPAGIDFVTHATQATMHDADDLAVMETLEALPDIIRSTRAFAGDVPYRLGPATIGMPASASASSPAANPRGGRVCMAGDEPRQRGLFAAAFALGYAAIAARDGIDALTFASPSGPFGLFDAVTGTARPIALVIAGLARLASLPRIDARVSGPRRIAALAAAAPEGAVLWLANLGGEATTVRVEGRAYRSMTVIDAAALARHPADAVLARPFAGNEIALDSYAVCRLT